MTLADGTCYKGKQNKIKVRAVTDPPLQWTLLK